MTKLKRRYIAVFFALIFQLQLLAGCALTNEEPKSDIDTETKTETEQDETAVSDSHGDQVKSEDAMRIKVSSEGTEIIFELNDSSASISFWEQLPLTVSVENYGNNEKVFNIPQRLDESNVRGGSCPKGSIAYFSPWNNVAMYCGDAPEYKGLYPMGTAIEGADKIAELSGSITVTAYTENTSAADS